ncbi:MAG: hypothetical protein NZ742_00235 [Acidobacteria bacterium]|nr:hypothetical protein [Acidobacteriota bacterium]MDW7983180.1 CsgG/HfaB family protein [Acidobacteriota bacterium]
MIRRTFAITLVVAWAAGLAWGQARPGKVRVAVLDFENNVPHVWWYWDTQRLGRAAADEIVTQLVRSGKFSVIERDKLELVLKEQALSASGAIDPRTAVRLGKLLGVQLILTGSITKFSIKRHGAGIGPLRAQIGQAQSALDVRLIDTSTGEIVLAASGEGEKKFGGAAFKNIDFEKEFDAGIVSEALRPAVEKTVAQILAQYDQLGAHAAAAVPALGKVVSADSPTAVYIDMGENAGVRVGDRFEVVRVVKEIRDEHGELLDTVEETVGTLEVTKVLSKSSVCRVIRGGAQKGDRVQKTRS